MPESLVLPSTSSRSSPQLRCERWQSACALLAREIAWNEVLTAAATLVTHPTRRTIKPFDSTSSNFETSRRRQEPHDVAS